MADSVQEDDAFVKNVIKGALERMLSDPNRVPRCLEEVNAGLLRFMNRDAIDKHQQFIFDYFIRINAGHRRGPVGEPTPAPSRPNSDSSDPKTRAPQYIDDEVCLLSGVNFDVTKY
jgi:hypothetical protein